MVRRICITEALVHNDEYKDLALVINTKIPICINIIIIYDCQQIYELMPFTFVLSLSTATCDDMSMIS